MRNYSELVANVHKRFGTLLHLHCERVGLSQGKLARLATRKRNQMLKEGALRKSDAIGSMAQPTISRVAAGLQAPSYFQVLLWISVVREYYKSGELAERCEQLGIVTPVFSARTERSLWALAGFIPPEKLEQALEQSAPVGKQQATRSLVDHRESRLSGRKGQEAYEQ